MKKMFVIASMAAAISMSAASVYAGGAGQVNFAGTITDAGCTITNTVSNPLNVKLGTYSSKEFTKSGDTTAKSSFKISLSDCPDTVTKASVIFDGTPDSNNTTLLKLTQDDGVATGVAIQLYDISGAELPLFTASKSYTLASGTNDLSFMAAYKSTAATVTAGPANAVANFSISYN